MKEVVTFFLSGKEYGIEVSRLQGAENYREMMKVPDMPEDMLGIVEIRGEKIPVLDIKKQVILPAVPVTDETKYVVIRTEHGKLAILADGVARIIRAEDDEIQPFPPLAQADGTSYVDFVVRHEGHLILVMNLEAFAKEEDLARIQNILKKIEEREKAEERERIEAQKAKEAQEAQNGGNDD
jgi:purine-binding chemotaxis protein CheW